MPVGTSLRCARLFVSRWSRRMRVTHPPFACHSSSVAPADVFPNVLEQVRAEPRAQRSRQLGGRKCFQRLVAALTHGGNEINADGKPHKGKRNLLHRNLQRIGREGLRRLRMEQSS